MLGPCHYIGRRYERAAELARLATQRAPRLVQHYLEGLRKAGWQG